MEAVPQVAPTHYDPRTYLSPQRLASFGYQIGWMAEAFTSGSVLEVGVGTGLAAQLLQQVGFSVTTLDIDARLNPTIVGSLTEIPAAAGQFQAFSCCQVLEHLPWDQVDAALAELRRVARSGGVISVPTCRRMVEIMHYSARVCHPRRLPMGTRFPQAMRTADGQHYWELEANVRTREFREKLQKAGFRIVRDEQIRENCYHHFFLLKTA